VVAAILRSIRLDSGLWYDEIETLVDFARRPLAQILGEYSKNNHPLYSATAHAALTWLGEHAWSLRVPSVVFGVACIPMVYVLGTVIASAREGLLAAGLLAVSYHHVWFSQNARGYTALAFWAMLSAVLLLKGLQGDRVRWYLAYGVAGALGIYTHLVTAFVILAHLLGWLWLLVRGEHPAARRTWRLAAIGLALAGTVPLLLYAPMLPQMYAAFRQPSDLREVATPRWAVREILRGLDVGFGAGGALVGLLLFGVGLRDYWRKRWLVVTLVLLPGLLTAAGTVMLRLPTQPRYWFFLIGFGALIVVRGAMVAGSWIAAAGLAHIVGRHGATAVGTILVGGLILANMLSLGHLYRHPKQDYVGAMRYVEAQRAIGDVVITAGLAVRPYRDYYGKPWQSVQTPEAAQSIRSMARRVWIVYASPEYMTPELLGWIRRECRATKVFPGTLAGGEVIVCTL
jgi:mannosyltransferase